MQVCFPVSQFAVRVPSAMSDLAETLSRLLSQVQRPGDFYTTGTVDIHPPRLEVDGVGEIALPLLPVQAEQIIANAEQAPYGRGSETLVDTAVRRTWQVDAARVHLSGRRWDEDLAQMVQRITAGLGVSGQIDAQLYKLLIYNTGSFFVTHRDSEKAPGMFATLVLVLPSRYRGGELIIRHKDHEVRLDLCRDEPSEAAYAAFYADCRHEVLPIVSGYRLALVYNLVRRNGGELPRPPDYDAEQQQVAALLKGWGAAVEDDRPLKLIYPLEHAYTEAELAFMALKGADAAVAAVMVGAARDADCDLHLALVSIEESGWADYAGGGRWGEVEYEIGEVIDSHQSLRHWRLPDGSAPDMGALPFTDDELSPPDALADLDEVEPDFQEATGNEGVSFERFYQRAALVLWPRTHRAAVLAGGGLAVSVPFLTRLVERWEQDGRKAEDALWQQAHELAVCIRHGWPEHAWERQRASKAGHGAALLDAFLRLGDPAGAAGFVAAQVAAGAYAIEDNTAIAATLARLPAEQAADLLTAVIANNMARHPMACAGLLALRAEQADADVGGLRPAALALLAALPGEPEHAAMPGTHAPQGTPDLIAYTLTALERIDGELAQRALALFLSRPATYPMDEVMLPAALAIAAARPGTAASGEPTSIRGLREAVLAHLDRRIAEPLAPPADWRRPAQIACRCSYCRDLNTFLVSTAEQVWRLKANQQDRAHVEQSVRRYRCDLDLTTDQRGRPYTLVCTKNQASYQRRVRQREQDLMHRTQLSRQ